MAAFEKIESGIPGLDETLDGIRLGDNVVWQISDLDEFRLFARAFVEQACKDGRTIIYIRFAQHAPILEDTEGVQVKTFDPDLGFESFTVAIHDEITRQGKDAFYVFDCLSELQSVWYTDLMMGNFFRVTCPYLFELDTVAYFPLMRGRHSFDAIARIRETTQLLLDVYTNKHNVYVHPLKVWDRYSDKMFLPHVLDITTKLLSPVEDGVEMSRFYETLHATYGASQDQNVDSYDRFFSRARADFDEGRFDADTEDQIIKSTVTKDPRLSDLVKRYFSPEDYFALRRRMIGSGAIGGKACGMLLSRQIVAKEIPDCAAYLEPHDSFYIGSDVYYTYIVSNGDWNLRVAQRTPEGYFTVAEKLKERLLQGRFPSKIKEQFMQVIDYFGQSPFIVRSSSFLEDGFGCAFAGKYESVFCVNQGTPEQRLEAFEQAVRRVYASTMSAAALEYRRARGVDQKDEQMAVLVQRVSGSRFGKYVMPAAAGVGYSHSAYLWDPGMDAAAGMLRIVMGLGTKAVDRTKEDYPRLASLDRPDVSMYTSAAQKHRFSQRYVDVLNCDANEAQEVSLSGLLDALPQWYKNVILEHDYEAENTLRSRGAYRAIYFVSCQGLLENRMFSSCMQRILKTLERIYENPVDTEFTVNINSEGAFTINLLQCRPLYLGKQGEGADLARWDINEVFFDITDSSMGSSGLIDIDVVVDIDPVRYYEYPYAKKYDVVSAIEIINSYYRGSGKHLLLMTPGRIGTSSPELGVPVNFEGISGFSAICEVSDDRAGYRPELSYGSHMFQDLVESEIKYCAIFNNEKTLVYNPGLFDEVPDVFEKVCPYMPQLAGMIRVRELKGVQLALDAVSNHTVCGRL